MTSTTEAGNAGGAPAPTANLLASFDGALPPAPGWFRDTLDATPEHRRVPVDGAEIDLLCWGERGKPGLLLIHGSNAHAHWWDHIAPLLANDWRVAALSLSGMGESDWRELYTTAIFEQELFAAAEAGGLYDAGDPVFVAHSFGGIPMATAAANQGHRLKGAIFLDSGFMPEWDRNTSPPPAFKPKEYDSVAAALARFRLMPPQACDNLYIADHIARHSLRAVDRDGEQYWTWSFDPDLWARMRVGWEGWEAIPEAKCPVAFISGERSAAITDKTIAVQRGHAPSGTPFIRVPRAEHHVMIDEPLALVAALRTLLEVWPAR